MPNLTDVVPTSPEAFSQRYDSSIVIRRWGATWIDLLFLALCCLAPLALPAKVRPVLYLFVVLLVIAYYPVLERLYGRTLGKFVCRVRVVNAAGAHPSWGQVVIRTLLRLVEVNPLALGGVPAGIAVLASRRRQRLGDMAADTFVLREEDYRYLGKLRTSLPAGAPPLLLPLLPPVSSAADNWLIPVNRSGWCIAAGYLGLFAVLVFPAPLALAAGLIGLRDIRLHPGLGGKGRAWFAIIMGAACSILLLTGLVAIFCSK